MFKTLLKTLQVAVISGALLNLNTIAFAQDAAPVPSVTRPPVAVPNTLNSNQQQISEKLTTKGAGDSNIMATLAMASISLLTQRLYTCKMTTDMMIAAAGGAAFIAGEILATIKLKQAMKDIETDLKRDDAGKIDQKQIEVLQKLRQSYVDAKGTANTKIMLQKAAAAAFALAGIMAYMNANAELAAQAAANAAFAAATTTCTSMFTASCAGAGATCVYPFQTGAAAATATAGTFNAFKMKQLGPADSFIKFNEDQASKAVLLGQTTAMATQCPAAAPAKVSLMASNALDLQTKGFCPVSPAVVNNEIAPKKKIKFNLFEILMSSAQADLLSPMGIVASAGTVYLLSKTYGAVIDRFLYAPINRAMTWGALGLLTYAATSATNTQIGIIDDNIKKIDDILAVMNALPAGVAAANTPPVIPKSPGTTETPYNGMKITNSGYSDVDLSGNGSGKLPCFTGNNSSACPTFSTMLEKRDDIQGIPATLMAQMKTLGAFADGLNGTGKVTASTLSAGGNLAASQNAISAALAKQQKAVQTKLSASGSKIDLAKNASDAEAKMRAALIKELKDKNTNAGAVLAGFNGYGANGPATSASNSGKENDKENNKKSAAGNAGAVVDISGASGASKADKGVEIEGLAKTDETTKIEAADAKATTIDDYALKNDITLNKDTSLFDLISNRYQKSGYPRLFKKVKE